MPHPIFNKDTSAINGTSVCMSPQDAKLIAAAPDLLEALRNLVAAFSQPIPIINTAPARAAIAKAITGESK